jgi:hypothetical protein
VDLGQTRDRQFLSLRTAAALAYMQLVGESPEARDGAAMQRVLNDIAHAISVVATIRTYDGTQEGDLPRELGQLDLIEGRFERGAAALVKREGTEVGQLAIQRRDLEAAISILSETGLGKALRERRG